MSWTLGLPQDRSKAGRTIEVTDGQDRALVRYEIDVDGRGRWVDERGRRLKWRPTHWKPVPSLSAASAQ